MGSFSRMFGLKFGSLGTKVRIRGKCHPIFAMTCCSFQNFNGQSWILKSIFFTLLSVFKFRAVAVEKGAVRFLVCASYFLSKFTAVSYTRLGREILAGNVILHPAPLHTRPTVNITRIFLTLYSGVAVPWYQRFCLFLFQVSLSCTLFYKTLCTRLYLRQRLKTMDA